jgi:cyclohexyl-isocyanide hydratase
MTTPSAITDARTAPLEFGMLLYPGFTLLDLAGPQAVLGLYGETRLLWKNLDPVRTDTGLSINPTTAFAECPEKLDVLFVPGGMGTDTAMADHEIVAFLATAGRTARWVTSVCSGSLLLGMAGLLAGYRATTHWAFQDALAATGAKAVQQRVVRDRNRMTGGGVTAGIDFGLTLLASLRDEKTAKLTQLLLEYDPEPPFDAGTPAKAGRETTDAVLSLVGAACQSTLSIAKQGRGKAPVQGLN